MAWRQQTSKVARVLEQVNGATRGSWAVESRFAGGVLEGAWRIRDGDAVAVLKWHDPGSAAPYNPDAPAIVETLLRAGYPTPQWLTWGVTDADQHWSVQELVDAPPLRGLDVSNAHHFIDVVAQQRTIELPTEMTWIPYVRDHVFTPHPLHRRLLRAGPNVRRLLARAIDLAAPFESLPLPATEMVHCDLNVSNLLVRDGQLRAVVDIDAAGRGCAAYDLASPAVNGVSWQSDPVAVELLIAWGLANYGAAVLAVNIACVLIETTAWYLKADPDGIEERAARHLAWLDGLGERLCS